MIIAAISVFLNDAVHAGSVSVHQDTLISSGHADMKDTVRKIIGSQETGMPIVMADINGMNSRKVSIDLLRKIRLRKAETWFMTYIEDVDDVFDVFSMDVDMLLMPLHHISSLNELKEIDSVSDKCMPCIFTNGRSAILKNGTEDLFKTIRAIKKIGQRIVVFPTETIDDEKWERMRSEFIDIIPVAKVPDDISTLMTMGFEDIISLIDVDAL